LFQMVAAFCFEGTQATAPTPLVARADVGIDCGAATA
jgi:hypothetical protein